MIKLQIDDATLATLDPSLLPFVQWKSLRLADFEGVSEEVLSANLFKMAKPVIKSLIKNNRVTTTSITDEQWIEIIDDAYNNSWNIMETVQLPYSVIMFILNDRRQRDRWSRSMATTQTAMPVTELLQYVDVGGLDNILYHGTNPALAHFMFTDEGLAILKERKINTRYFRSLTSAEFEKVGVRFRNRRISVQLLDRAGACDNGKSYCRKFLNELGLDSITWDEAIVMIRNSKKLQNRPSLYSYVSWVHERSNNLEAV